MDVEDIERAVSFGEVGAERGGVRTDAGGTKEGDLEPGLWGSFGGPSCCDLALLIAELQSNESVAADMGLMAGVVTFSKDSLRLFVSSVVVPLLCRSIGYVAMKLLVDGLSSAVPPSEESEMEWNDEMEEAGA